mmetsp:Transcript_24444/g.70416  ORF Transcript_24444/g.70416 Transcript_24444/m.70416 type:complete len:760 (+) Transcript_24444:97-2376(+)
MLSEKDESHDNETMAPLLTDEEAAAGEGHTGDDVGSSSPEELSYQTTAQFWSKCLLWPASFVGCNAVAFHIISAIMEHSVHLRATEFKRLREKGHATAEDAAADWFAPHHEEVVEERAWYAAHGSLAFAFLLFCDAVVLVRFAQGLERRIVRYCDELERRCDAAYGADATKDLGDNVHLPAEIADERSSFAREHADAFACHRLELFLRNATSVKRSILTKTSAGISALYLLASVALSCCIAFTVRYGMITLSSGQDGSYCFINPYVNMPAHCESGYAIAESANQTAIPGYVRHWFEKKYAVHPDCNSGNEYQWGAMENNRTSSVIDMVDGDTFFVGRAPGEHFDILMKKTNDGKTISFPSVQGHWIENFQSDSASRSADGLLTSFCLPYTRWFNKSGFEDPDYHYDRDNRVLCYSTDLRTQQEHFFPNISLHFKNNNHCDYLESYTVNGDILFMLCKPSLKKKKKTKRKNSVWDDDDRFRDMDDDYVYEWWTYHHPPHFILDIRGMMKLSAFNITTMNMLGSFDIPVEATSPHHRHEQEHRWCDSTHSWAFAILETIFAFVASAVFSRKGLPITAVVLVGAAGCVLRIFVDDAIFSFIFSLLSIVVSFSALANKPARPQWLSKQSFWWLIYAVLITPLIWGIFILSRKRRNECLISLIGLIAIYIKYRHPVFKVAGFLLLISCFLVLPSKILDLSPLKGERSRFGIFGCLSGIFAGFAMINLGPEIDRHWRPFIAYLCRVFFAKMKKLWLRLKKRIRRR